MSVRHFSYVHSHHQVYMSVPPYPRQIPGRSQHNRNHNLLHFISFSRTELCCFFVAWLFVRFHFALYALQQFLNGRLAVLLTLVPPKSPPWELSGYPSPPITFEI